MRCAVFFPLLACSLSILGCVSGPPPGPETESPLAGGKRQPEGESPSSGPSVPVRAPSVSVRAHATETRAVWVTRWDFSRADDVRRIMEEISAAGFNAVFFQVRGTADAYYRSSLEPWAARLAGKLGSPPGWDPLEVAVAEAHRRGMKLHAWVNAFTAWKKNDPPPGRSRPPHPMGANPKWLLRDQAGEPFSDKHGYVFFDPAHPEYRRHLGKVVAELVSFYELDGLHLDYFRFPAADLPLRGESQNRYLEARKANPLLTPAAWRRERLASLLKSLYHRAHKIRPAIEVSTAVIGIRRNLWGWADVVQGLDDFHQDAYLFAERGAVDTLVPMLYWPPTDPPGGRADFLTLARDFAPLQDRVRLVAGINLEAGDYQVLEREILLARQQGFSGTAFFSYALWKERSEWGARLRQGPWKAQPPRLTGTARGPAGTPDRSRCARCIGSLSRDPCPPAPPGGLRPVADAGGRPPVPGNGRR